MAEIILTQGQIALVDDADVAVVEKYKWHVERGPSQPMYAVAQVPGEKPRRSLKMHRLLLGLKPGDPGVDHKNGNGLDNRRENLRMATGSQNSANSNGKLARRKSRWKGVCWHKDSRRPAGGYWYVSVGMKGGRIQHRALSELDAAKQYNTLATRLHGAFARLNEIP